ncbi:type III pantothenate kinase [Maribacter sp. 2210JD10-5]|uniref:type III pantothenate kinase n=1 Tax=Maribacter sp. 2210JD10-5 TaxID=3386272 RepID=UPI0039BD5897
MNLIIDAGNTRIKLAVFQKNNMVYNETITLNAFQEGIKFVFEKYPRINAAIVSSVGFLTKSHEDILQLYCKVHKLSYKSNLPFKNSYATPQTLGVDRIALVAAAYYNKPHSNTLVIDTGSCITFDIINDFDEYLGGAISPGIQMRYTAMHEQTSRLPLLKREEVLDYIGNSTENSMHSGVIYGVANEIDAAIDMYKSRFKDLTVILTGGDAQFLSERLKNTIFADSKFLLKGLNHLLEYNKF